MVDKFVSIHQILQILCVYWFIITIYWYWN